VRSIDIIPGVCLDLPIIFINLGADQMPSKGEGKMAGGSKYIGSKNAIERGKRGDRVFCPKRRGSAVFHLNIANIISAGGDDEWVVMQDLVYLNYL
jgi:hypothetical protein